MAHWTDELDVELARLRAETSDLHWSRDYGWFLNEALKVLNERKRAAAKKGDCDAA